MYIYIYISIFSQVKYIYISSEDPVEKTRNLKLQKSSFIFPLYNVIYALIHKLLSTLVILQKLS